MLFQLALCLTSSETTLFSHDATDLYFWLLLQVMLLFIGLKAGKLIAYELRCKRCDICDTAGRLNIEVKKHDCRKNLKTKQSVIYKNVFIYSTAFVTFLNVSLHGVRDNCVAGVTASVVHFPLQACSKFTACTSC